MPGKKVTSAAGSERVPGARISPAHHSFVYKIGILRRVLDRYSGPAFTQRSGLTLAEWRVLTNLYSFSPTTSRQLCLRLHTDKAEVSRACAALIASGYAKRRADPHDRRSALIVITPRGERLHDQIIPLRQALQHELETPLSGAEIADLHRILDKLLAFFAGRIASGPAPAAARKPRQPRAGTARGRRADLLTIQRTRQ